MNVYVVASAFSTNELVDAIRSQYPETHHAIIDRSVWVVGTKEQTPYEVSATLGIDLPDRKTGVSGVVVKVDSYYGFYDPGLWQRIQAWEQQPV